MDADNVVLERLEYLRNEVRYLKGERDQVHMSRFRNLIVHDYTRIDDAIVYSILTRRLGDFDAFAQSISTYLQRR